MGNITRLRYNHSLINTYITNTRTLSLIEERAPIAMRKIVKTALLDAIPEGGFGDVHLEASLSTARPLAFFLRTVPEIQSILLFPETGRLESYVLNPRGEFFSNNHQEIDPTIVVRLRERVFLTQSVPHDYLWSYGGKSRPNLISGLVLFKQNPFQNPKLYPGFDKFIEHSKSNHRRGDEIPYEATHENDFESI